MQNQPISTRLPSVAVEYDNRGQRVRKEFTDAYAARRFYTQKMKDGKNPQVKGTKS